MKRRSHWLAVMIIVLSTRFLVSETCVASTWNTYYVSTSGKDTNNGSAGSPWRTIAHAVAQVPDSNSTIIVQDGVYEECVGISRRFVSSLLIEAEHPYRARWQCDESLPILKIGKG